MESEVLMNPYLRNNLWKAFPMGTQSFTRLGDLYSFSAISLELEQNPLAADPLEKSPMRQFLQEYAKTEPEATSPEKHRILSRELEQWFEQDWMSIEDADEYLLELQASNPSYSNQEFPYRYLLSDLLFHPQRIQPAWLKRLWKETLARHGGNRISAEVELLFLCEKEL